MLVLLKSLIRPILEYCSEVWSPYLKKDIVLLEQIQRSFTSKIEGLQELDYWERLQNLGISSLQRRREKMIVLHIWKIKNGFYPNTISLQFKFHGRSNSFKAICKPLPKVNGTLLTKYEESFMIKGCKLWNTLPQHLTHITSLDSFKHQLQIFCNSVPDKPPLPGYPFLNNNSLTEQCLR